MPMIVLLAPSPKALQNLLNICVNFAEKHGLVYNERKTKFMCIKPAALKNMYVPNVNLMEKIGISQDRKIPWFHCQ